jgi:hypothetical protein
MPTSRHRKKHKAKTVIYKQQNKLKTMSEQPQAQGLPEVRQRPYWNSHETLELSGLEFEYIYNAFQPLTNAFAALNSILNNNIVKGKILVGFEKLVTDPAGVPNYVPMTEEEQAPYKAEFNKVLEAARQAAEQVTSKIVIPTADEVAQISKEAEGPKKRGRKPKLEVVK